MANHDFDKIVVGAGMAGVACAGELARLGERPLLICETKEVGAMYALKNVGEKSRGFQQHLAWQPAWGGGWWYPLARGLDIPLSLYHGFRFAAKLQGSDKIANMPMCASAAAVMEFLVDGLGLSFEAESRAKLKGALEAALAIPYDELVRMHEMSLVAWLDELGADEVVKRLFLTFGGSPNGMSIDDSAKYLSVYGGIASLRAMVAGEVLFPMPYPSIREGLLMPIADEVERRGGAVWRGRKVKQVLIDSGCVEGVEMEDGTRVRAPVVAIATGNARIPALLDPLPPEIEQPITRAAKAAEPDINVYALLDKPVIPADQDRLCIGTINPETGYCHWVVPLHGIAPWLVEPGKQLLVSWLRQAPGESIEDDDLAMKKAMDLAEDVLPGFLDGVEHAVTSRRPHDFTAPLLVGPKLTRTIPSVSGLWFVGDGSVPFAGIWSEGAASSGVLGAREMLGQV